MSKSPFTFLTIFLLISFFASSQENIIQSDTLFTPNYPEGIYATKSDFINKSPSSSAPVFLVGLLEDLESDESIVHNPYFYYKKDEKKVKNVFAISFKGHLYFQIKAILKNRNKNDKAQSTSYPNTFVRVIIGGENYYYTEAELANKWATGTAVNFGAVGGIIAEDLIKGKGIVWDFKNQEFNIFKSCEDYNEFITNIYPDGIQECNDHQPNPFRVREVISIIK